MPYVIFSTKADAPEGSDLRNTAYLIAHCWFLFFNVINVSYLAIFEGFIYGKLKGNFIMKLTFAACLIQISSCLTSIHRYNIDEEYGIYGILGTLFGLLAFTPFNIAYVYVFFHKNSKNFIKAGSIIWIILATATMLGTIKIWETDNFAYFRVYVGASTAWHIVSNIRLLLAHKKGDVKIDPSIGTSDEVNKTLLVAIILEVAAGLGAASKIPVLQYPGTGLTFSLLVIVSRYAGNMDFMKSDYTSIA